MSYMIQPEAWERIDESRFEYWDDELNMRVVLELDSRYYPMPWQRMEYNGWSLLASSMSVYDEDNVFYYDAMEPEFTCRSWCSRAYKSFFFDEDGELKPVCLPEWVIERMRFCDEQDDEANDDFVAWAEGLESNRFDSYEEMHDSAWTWYAGHHLDGGQYPDGADMMIRMGDVEGCIISHQGGYIVNP